LFHMTVCQPQSPVPSPQSIAPVTARITIKQIPTSNSRASTSVPAGMDRAIVHGNLPGQRNATAGVLAEYPGAHVWI